MWDPVCRLWVYDALLDLNQGGALAVDGGKDLMMDWDLKVWNEENLYGLIMFILDLYTNACVVLKILWSGYNWSLE